MVRLGRYFDFGLEGKKDLADEKTGLYPIAGNFSRPGPRYLGDPIWAY
jgi:hypothetical protein